MHFPKRFDYFVLKSSFGLEKIQSLLLYFKYSGLIRAIKQPNGYTQFKGAEFGRHHLSKNR